MTTEELPETLPAVTDQDLRAAGLPSMIEMSPGLAIFFNDALYQRCKNIAKLMSGAASMVPDHLRDKPEACFAVVSRSIVWKLDPYAVAMSTYTTPGGSIGYEGKLIQAILERSGQVDGQIRFTHNGDWAKLRGKFELKDGKTGGKYPVRTWTQEDAIGLSVTVAARIKGEQEDRTLEVWLESCWPLNSPLWATDPRRQICYTAVRAFANLATPSLLFGIPFDVDPVGLSEMVDITPKKPEASEFARSPEKDNQVLGDFTAKANFANNLGELSKVRAEGLAALPADLKARFEETCDNRGRQISSQMPADQCGHDQRQDADPPASEGDQADDQKGGNVEPPFQRGQRLLAGLTDAGDVVELHLSIAEELSKKKDKDLWRQTCEAKWKELGGTGKMLTKVGG